MRLSDPTSPRCGPACADLVRRSAAALALIFGVWAWAPAAVEAQEFSLDSAVPAIDRAVPDAIIDRVDFTSSVSLGLTYTDNVDFEQDARSDLFLFVRPQAALRVSGRRVDLALNFGFEAGYSTDENGFDIRQVVDSSLQSTNRFELVEEILFLDFSAALSREIVDNRIGTSARDATDQNRTLVQRYRVSPFIVYRFGSFAENETRLTAAYFRSGETSDDDVDTGDDDDNDSITLAASTAFSSGSAFTTVLWDFVTSYRVEDVGDDDELREFSTLFSTQTPIVRQFALLANIGYDDIDRDREDGLGEEDLDGLRWDVGFTLQPSPNFSLTFTGGQRYGEANYFGDLGWEISPGSTLTANYQRTFDTESGVFLEDLSFLGVNPQGELIDIRTGEPPEVDTESFGITDRAFFRDRFNANLFLDRRRNTYRFSAFWEQREFIDGPADTESSYGGGAAWSRRLSRETSGNLAFDYRIIDFGEEEAGREDTRYTGRLTLSHALGRGFSLSGSYVYQLQQSTLDAEDGISENAVTIRLTKTF